MTYFNKIFTIMRGNFCHGILKAFSEKILMDFFEKTSRALCLAAIFL
jgi:hypothetical protein